MFCLISYQIYMLKEVYKKEESFRPLIFFIVIKMCIRDRYMIEHLVNITNLMCGNHNRLIIRHPRCDKLTELAFSGNIQSVRQMCIRDR